MSYVPTNWQDAPSTATPTSAANFNKLETGVDEAHNFMDKVSGNQALPVTAGFVLIANGSLYVPRALLSTDIPGWVRKTISGTTYTMAADDGGKLLEFTAATPVTVTLPTQTSVTTPADAAGGWCQYGAGVVTFVAASGVTRTSRGNAFSTAGQGAEGGWRRRGTTDEWVISGDLVV